MLSLFHSIVGKRKQIPNSLFSHLFFITSLGYYWREDYPPFNYYPVENYSNFLPAVQEEHPTTSRQLPHWHCVIYCYSWLRKFLGYPKTTPIGWIMKDMSRFVPISGSQHLFLRFFVCFHRRKD